MAELTLRPNGAGDDTEHHQLPDAGDNFDKVNEVVPSDADYVYSSTVVGAGSKDLYTLPAHGLPGGTIINKITLHGRWYKGYNAVGFTGNCRWVVSFPLWDWAEVVTDNGDPAPFSEWFTAFRVHLVNPETSEHWTLDELTNMQIGSYLKYAFRPNVARESRNGHLYIVVDYQPGIVAPTVTTDPATEIT